MRASLLTLTVLLAFPAALTLTDTILLDDFAVRRTATLHIGDSLLFKRRLLQNLYLLHNRRAFDHCIFEDATPIFHGKSTYFAWTPPLPGHYYFSTKDEDLRSCEKGDKVLVRVIVPELSPALPPEVESAPPPTAGGDLPSSPTRGRWTTGGLIPPPRIAPETSPREPREGSSSIALPPEADEGMPFINSNPAVPLPTGETDTATARPLPTPSERGPQFVGVAASLRLKMTWLATTLIMANAL